MDGEGNHRIIFEVVFKYLHVRQFTVRNEASDRKDARTHGTCNQSGKPLLCLQGEMHCVRELTGMRLATSCWHLQA
jgi:hypothetical protein